MIRILRFIAYFIFLIVGVAISMVFGAYTYRIPILLPFFLMMFIFFIFSELFTMIMQGKSPQVLTTIGERGYWSINRKDIHYKPWFKNTNGSKTQIGELCIMMVGGIDYWSINPKSNSDYPVLIFPSTYQKQIGLCYEVNCNFQPFNFNQLNPEIRHYLKNKYGRRIKDNTPIYFGATSLYDGTATPDNDKLLEKMRVENEYTKKLEEIIEGLYKELKKYDERKAKQYFIREAGSIDEG